MDKLGIEEMSESSGNDKISPFNTVHHVNSKIIKAKSDKTLKMPAAMKLNVHEIEEDLQFQISTANKLIEQFKMQLPDQATKHPKNSVESLRLMEDSIRSKDQLIQEIQEEIKMLKNGSYSSHSDHRQKNKLDQTTCFPLTQQIRILKEELIKWQNKFLEKYQDLQHKKVILASVQKKYQEKCKKQGLKEITFDEFQHLYKKKKKEELLMNKHKKFHKKQTPSIKQIIREKQFQTQNKDSKKMKELTSKKMVAETALKTARKKHMIEMNDLMGKLEFLRDENNDLEQKLILKEQQLKLAQGKFSESRNSSEKRILPRRFKTEQKLL